MATPSIFAGLGGALVSGLFGAVNSMVNNSFAASSNKVQYLQQKQLMKYQQQLNQQNAAQQQGFAERNAALADQYQRSLMVDEPMLEKQGLRNAGISVASMNGQFGTSQPTAIPQTPQVGTVGLGSTGAPSLGFDMLSSMKLLAELDLLQSQSEKNEAEKNKTNKETSWIDDVNEANVHKTIADTAVAEKELLHLSSEIDYNISRMKLTKEQKEKVSIECDKLIAETKAIRINNDYIAQLNESKLKQIDADVQKAIAEKDLTQVRYSFARLGIGISDDFLSTLAALCASGDAARLVPAIVDGFGDAVKAVVDKVKDETKHTPAQNLNTPFPKGVEFIQGIVEKLKLMYKYFRQ